ncbi:NifB/NifX family molybdenum-iron cluster-binding protein [bacterium]|nr:NifB/NifX family molybdenum-iron cluster-binding protein [bacterium]
MKIAIASDDEKAISTHFGRARGFVVFDIEGNEIKSREYRLNTFSGHARGLEEEHESDHHKAILNALSDCKVVISKGMGKRIYDDLKSIGIEVYITDETDVKRALELYINGKLVNKPNLGCSHKHK